MTTWMLTNISHILAETPLIVYVVVIGILLFGVIKFIISHMFSVLIYAVFAVLVIIGFLTVIKLI